MKEKANVVVYDVDNEYLIRVEDLLIEKLEEWYKQKGLDLIVTTFTLGGLGRIQVDCEMESKANIETIKDITNEFLNGFKIRYTYHFERLD